MEPGRSDVTDSTIFLAKYSALFSVLELKICCRSRGKWHEEYPVEIALFLIAPGSEALGLYTENFLIVPETSFCSRFQGTSLLPGVCICVCVCILCRFNHVQLFVTLWTIAHKAPQSLGFARQEYWSGLPCPPPGDLPDPGIKPGSPALQEDSLPLSHQRAS